MEDCEQFDVLKTVDCSYLELIDDDLVLYLSKQYEYFTLILNGNYLQCPDISKFFFKDIELYQNPFLECSCTKVNKLQFAPPCQNNTDPTVEPFSENQHIVNWIVTAFVGFFFIAFIIYIIFKMIKKRRNGGLRMTNNPGYGTFGSSNTSQTSEATNSDASTLIYEDIDQGIIFNFCF